MGSLNPRTRAPSSLTMAAVLLVRPQGLFGIKYTDVPVAPAVVRTSSPTTVQRRFAELATLLVLALLPFTMSDYPRALVSEIFIFAIFAMSLDLLVGFTGLVSLGHAAFFGFGAYTAGLIAKAGWGEPITGLMAAAVAAMVLGYLTSFIIVRISHFALNQLAQHRHAEQQRFDVSENNARLLAIRSDDQHHATLAGR